MDSISIGQVLVFIFVFGPIAFCVGAYAFLIARGIYRYAKSDAKQEIALWMFPACWGLWLLVVCWFLSRSQEAHEAPFDMVFKAAAYAVFLTFITMSIAAKTGLLRSSKP